jgi:hypothetical protein
MDLFGGVSVDTTSPIGEQAAPSARVTRHELFTFIESELLTARPDLTGGGGHFSKGAVDAILANMYINAGVFTKDGAGAGGINATGYNSCTGVQVAGGLDACQAALNRADSVINAGYVLATNYAAPFASDNGTSAENVFVIKFAPEAGLGLNFVMRALHYNQFTPGPWNGFSALAQTYNAFDSLDQRRKIFLVGPQVNVETGLPVKDRPGNPLVFTTSIANVQSATEGEGARIYKWPADPKHVAQDNGNDFAWFRLPEMYFIKAEAELNGATGSSTPLALVRLVRARAFPGGDTLSAVTLNNILRERLFEFTGEGKRRQDLVRFGLYTAPFEFKTTLSDPSKVLMPIPQSQIDANPLITQNPGY